MVLMITFLVYSIIITTNLRNRNEFLKILTVNLLLLCLIFIVDVAVNSDANSLIPTVPPPSTPASPTPILFANLNIFCNSLACLKKRRSGS